MKIYRITVFFPYKRIAFNREDKFILANNQEEAENIANEYYDNKFIDKNYWTISNIDSIEIDRSKVLS